MRLGLNSGGWSTNNADLIARAQEAERLGYHSLWTAEVYGTDAVTTAAWLLANTSRINVGTGIMQMTARVPTVTAMSAMTLDMLSGGRFLIGIGASGPQVVEGWHGVAYGQPLKRTREYIEIMRAVLAREKPLEHHGDHYDVPLRGGTGLGKPLMLINRPVRAQIPIYIAAIGPQNVAMTAEIADGWLPIFFSPFRMSVWNESLAKGFAKGGKDAAGFDISPSVSVVVGDDLDKCRAQIKPGLAFYIGGMGARDKNFYNDLARRYGYEDAARRIQDLFLSRKRDEATAAVPDELVDEVALIGPRERIKERLQAWKESGVTTLRISAASIDTVRMMAELAA
ncbi:MAG: LLM class F420-dependent oxidoreductase [Chloroflexi bacterium]|nr:LLM class F420-dependent oxidoreductase [Chloroflexota bacterium]